MPEVGEEEKTAEDVKKEPGSKGNARSPVDIDWIATAQAAYLKLSALHVGIAA